MSKPNRHRKVASFASWFLSRQDKKKLLNTTADKPKTNKLFSSQEAFTTVQQWTNGHKQFKVFMTS